MLRRAIAADPSYFPPHLRLANNYAGMGRHLELRRLYDSLPDHPVTLCMRAFVAAPAGYRVHGFEQIVAVEKRFGATPCTAYLRAYLTPVLLPKHVHKREQLVHTTRAVRLLPEVAHTAVMHAHALRKNDPQAPVEGVLRGATARVHLLERLALLSALRDFAATPGASLAIKRELQETAALDRRPGVLMMALDPWRETGAARRRTLLQQVDLARKHRARARELVALAALANEAINSGDNAAALRYLNRASWIAGTLESHGYRMLIFRLRGRAHSKVGDVVSARRDLDSAIAVYPQVRDDYELAETYHNLGHVYEGAGRLREAAAAMDRFVALTRPFVHAQPKMMSLHDAAEVRWKAGWHAAAEGALGEMVRVIDAQQSNHYWAGEYFERAGDYEQARRYYRAGVQAGEQASLNYAGLVRVFETLGFNDSAAVAAARHDRVMADQLDLPLRPAFLLRHGRAGEAIRIARDWVATKVTQQHVQGEARARNALAEIYLAAGRPGDALVEARRADAQAARLNLAAERATAQRLLGLAQARAGDVRGGRLVLERAVRGPIPGIEERRATHMALAEARALAGDTAGALAQYRRAASQVDTIGAGLIEDMARARFRAQQRLPFDRAVALLLASPERNIAGLVEWSQLRKASALAFVGATPPIRSLEDIQRSIAADELVIDFMMVDTAVSALLLTRTAARVAPLPVSPAEVTALIDRVRGPLLRVHAGRIDLARAPFDSVAARRLYAALIAPLITDGKVRRLTIAPDGPLHGVVFDALLIGSTRAFLIDRYTLRQVPSLALLRPARATPARPRILIVSRATPGGALEVAGIQSALAGARVSILDGARATEPAVQRQRAAVDVVHIATHARADERDPMGSYLELTKTHDADGYLHVNEIAASRADHALVVLSACETLGGPIFAGEGVMGVARAFLAGGARTVVATTWPVGAATAELMTTFYRRLGEGESVPAALRTAKLQLRRSRATAHPFYWASFIPITQ